MGGGATSAVGTGGMKTKIEAAEKATSHGIDTFIVNGFKSASFNSLLEGKNPGTFFRPYAKPMQEHDHWMRHTASEQGEVVVNNDFDTEFSVHGEQLTSDEIVEVNGSFAVGDTILLRKDDGTRIAKARSNYSSCLLSFIADQDDREFAGEFQNRTGPIISKKNIASLEKQ